MIKRIYQPHEGCKHCGQRFDAHDDGATLSDGNIVPSTLLKARSACFGLRSRFLHVPKWDEGLSGPQHPAPPHEPTSHDPTEKGAA